MPDRPTVVIGLDGATWRLLEEWMEEGHLPTLAEIRANSTWAVQRSCLPPVTSPNWKCYSTGKDPGKLGVYWWEIVDVEEQEIRIPDSSSYDSAEIFDYFGEAGKQWASINMPTTYPPHGGDNGGVMISGGSAARGESYVSPPELQEEIESRFDYRVVPELEIDEAGAVDEILELVESRFEVARHLLEQRDLDLLHLTVFLCNKLQHYFWDDEPTLRVWKRIDRNLEWFVERDFDLVFTSDHGSNEIDSEFQLNVWLEEEGYLVRESRTKRKEEVASSVGLTQHQLSELTDRLGIRALARSVVPEALIDRLPKQGHKKEHKLAPLDWQRTEAVGSGQGLVYLTDPDAPDADELRREIADKLASLEDPITGGPVAKEVYLRDEVYSGNRAYAPDVVFDQGPGIHTEDMVGEYDLFREPSNWRGENERDGIFMVHGPSFAERGRIDPTSITDVAPTILHLNGIPVPEDVDGSPLPVFGDGDIDASEVASQEPLPTPSRGTGSGRSSEALEEQLRDLGYLS